jgi:hypothetical protein
MTVMTGKDICGFDTRSKADKIDIVDVGHALIVH